MRLGTLFTGGGGFDIGARNAGLELPWGLEWDADIAAWANAQLGDHIRVGDVTQADPADFPAADWLHASPPCPSFSVANAKAGETEQDVAMGEAVARFLLHHRPKFFSLENVYGYRKSVSWSIIVSALHAGGYGFIVEHVNAADHGVPQKRRRMIVRAERDTFFSPPPMRPTHSEGGAGGLLPWVGWWAAVADIADTFPPSKLAPWQVRRLGGGVGDNLLIPGGNTNSFTAEAGARPARTIGDTGRVGNIPRAVLVEGVSKGERPPTTKAEDDPAFVTETGAGGRLHRAILVTNAGDQPQGHPDRKPVTIDGGQPVTPVTSQYGGRTRAILAEGSRVVALTTRALARLQTFPDWYDLPEKKTLAVTIIGNAVPALLAQRIVESML